MHARQHFKLLDLEATTSTYNIQILTDRRGYFYAHLANGTNRVKGLYKAS